MISAQGIKADVILNDIANAELDAASINAEELRPLFLYRRLVPVVRALRSCQIFVRQYQRVMEIFYLLNLMAPPTLWS